MEDNEQNIDRQVRNSEIYRNIANEWNKTNFKKVSVKILIYILIILLFELAVRYIESY